MSADRYTTLEYETLVTTQPYRKEVAMKKSKSNKKYAKAHRTAMLLLIDLQCDLVRDLAAAQWFTAENGVCPTPDELRSALVDAIDRAIGRTDSAE